MALDTAFYLVTKEIAQRSGLIDVRYRTLDNRFILDNKDLSRVRFTTDEYISGLKGVGKITEAEAQTLIAKGGYKKGLPESNMSSTPIKESEQEAVERVEETQESAEEETVSNDNGEKEETVETNEKEEEE